jgi:hypothetical protein
MVSSYLESLIEKVGGVDRALPDQDGDYVVPIGGAHFWARVDGDSTPVVRVYSTVLANVWSSPSLLEAVNEINTQATFVRAFWASDTVMFEHEHLGSAMTEEGFLFSLQAIAHASDYFGPRLMEQFGGTAAFEDAKSDDYKAEPGPVPGYF